VCGRFAHYIHPDDGNGWRDAMYQIIENADWRAELAIGVREYVGRFTWERCAEQTLDTYRLIADKQPDQISAAA
jgi:alpha-1,3-rhamnosyl/mannosyltransferase